jgi:hypothetical protein
MSVIDKQLHCFSSERDIITQQSIAHYSLSPFCVHAKTIPGHGGTKLVKSANHNPTII